MTNQKSIAVLPFDNLSSDPENEYFSDGMTEEIINALSRIDGLKVTARTSSFVFKSNKQDIRKIGKDLGVAMVMEGSVRKSNDRVRITAQLIRSEDGFHIWSENFDRKLNDIFELQDEISLIIADKVREHSGHFEINDHLVEAPTDNITAYQLYLKGRYYFNKWTLPTFKKAAACYKKSIEEDPSFVLPYFGAGFSYSCLGSWGGMDQKPAYELVRSYYDQGKKLDGSTFFGLMCESQYLFWACWEYKKAYEIVTQAHKLNPNDSELNEYLAEIHTTLGDFDAAWEYIELSTKLNPLSPNHCYTEANYHYLKGDFETALESIEKGLLIVPEFIILVELKLACFIHLGREESLLKTVDLNKGMLQYPDLYHYVYNLFHKKSEVNQDEVLSLYEEMQSAEITPLVGWDLILLLSAGMIDASMKYLEVKVEERRSQYINFKHDPFYAPLRPLSEFTTLAKQRFPDTTLTAFSSKKECNSDVLSETEASTYQRLLLDQMEQERYHLNSELSLKELADKIQLHPNKLSWLLNERLHKNYYDFINSYRLKEFQERALDKENAHLSILGLAYESGFSSKSVFNDYFKKTTGSTPKNWIKQNK
ncbi:MAG: helix-turn-helix domain-containing protein [Ekhidna sp.]|nr:helix-turn-helix domain-containing protein [Ekhidna sp.]